MKFSFSKKFLISFSLINDLTLDELKQEVENTVGGQEEDKTTDTSIEFWFRCCNLDNDGVITVFEMEHFYREQL